MQATMSKARAFCRRHVGKIAALATGATFGTLALSGVSGATGTTLEDSFTSAQTSLLTDMGYGAVLVVALLVFGLGIRILVKWSKKGANAS